ncbi:hypothetical protein DDE05_24835, partial [Streptomyces cavourensis]
MNNLHRELAPVTPAAWTEIEEEARRTFRRHVAGRRVVDVSDPDGPTLAAVGDGHLRDIDPPAPDVLARARTSMPVIEWRVPFTVSRQAVDDVERGSADSDWQPVKDAARTCAFAEDMAIIDGYAAAGITGLRDGSSHDPLPLPADARDYPVAVSQAVTRLRLAGVDGPYRLLLGADAFTEAAETSDHGYPVKTHLSRIVDDEILWAPAVKGGVLLSTRGGDFELCLGQDLSIGYADHDATSVHLYFQQAFTFRMLTAEAVVCAGREVSLKELFQAARAAGRELSADGHWGGSPRSVAFNAQWFRLAVDPGTGEIRILRSVHAADAGKVMNPMQCRGQVEGGVAQALGATLFENVRLDGRGEVTTAALRRYRLPQFADVPRTEVHFMETSDAIGPLGAKSMSESPFNPVAPA